MLYYKPNNISNDKLFYRENIDNLVIFSDYDPMDWPQWIQSDGLGIMSDGVGFGAEHTHKPELELFEPVDYYSDNIVEMVSYHGPENHKT